MAAAAALALSTAAFAQTTVSQQIQLIAPQLVPFSGSTGNFDGLVNGLTSGSAITLTSVGLDGSLQIVTFVPGITLSPLDAARALESARQSLITRGIATPSGQQLAAALVGGTVTTPSGTSALTGILTGTTTPANPVQVRTETALLLSGASDSNLSPAQLQAVRNALLTGAGVTLTTGTGAATQTVSFLPSGPLSDLAVNQALQLANALLVQQGILNPTAADLRAALFGGVLLLASGVRVPVQGVLQGQSRSTSDSAVLNTSASPPTSTSDSPTNGSSISSLIGTIERPAPVNPSVGPKPTPGAAGLGGAVVAPRGSTAAVVRPGAR
jgi:hypothetical protein